MSSVAISDVLFMYESDSCKQHENRIEIRCIDSGESIKNTDLVITVEKPINANEFIPDYIYIQGISNILLLRKYLDHVIDLHDRDLVA